ncbi:MAG: hypothetical protein GY913_18860 [Proteobacteria bacterium]|nr:hypothetical protein [Pseudomonadota bacterium]MCP4918972.1 hypothetical protein [Pseudomonadota bacterium]
MDASAGVILGVAALLGINRLIWVGDSHRRLKWVVIQLLNVTGASYMVLWGVPDFVGNMAIANYVLAALIVFHSIQNGRRLRKEERESADGADSELEDRRAEVRARLKDGGKTDDKEEG